MYFLRFLFFLVFFGAWKIGAIAASSPLIFQHDTSINSKDISTYLIDKQGHPTKPLKKLLILDDIHADDFPTILKETQSKWIAVRQGINGLERRDIQDTSSQLLLRQEVLHLARDLHLLDASLPESNHYDYACFLGAFLESSKARLKLLVECWKKGVRFDQLIFLGGDRPLRLNPGENETLDVFFASKDICPSFGSLNEIIYETEYDMLKLLWEQYNIPMDMRSHLKEKVIFIHATAKESGKRASTADSYRQWLNDYKPKPGTVLAISSPLVGAYQHLVGKNIMSSQFPVDTIYDEAKEENLKVSIILDTVAKCLYEFSKMNNKNLKQKLASNTLPSYSTIMSKKLEKHY